MLQYEKEFAAVLTAVNVHVTEVYALFVCFDSDVCPETLGKRGFSSANIACYYNPLGHSFWETQQEIEKFHQQAVFFLSVKQTVGDVVDVEFCFVFEHTLMGRHRFKPQINYVWAVLFFSLVIILFRAKA
jgi:hypothetical protein